MSNVDTRKLRKDIIRGMKISSKKLIEEKKKYGRPIAVSENGVVKIIKAEDI